MSGFPEGTGIGIGQSKGEHTPQHSPQVFLTVAQRVCSNGGIAVAQQIQVDQRLACKQEDGRTHRSQSGTDVHLEPEGVADALLIAGAVEGLSDHRYVVSGEECLCSNEKSILLRHNATLKQYGIQNGDHLIMM